MSKTDGRSGDEARGQLDELEEIYRSAPVGLCLVDREFRFVRVNDRLAAINGLSAAEHIGRTIMEIIPDLSDQVLPRLQKVIETGQPIENVEVPDAEGARTWLTSDHPLKDSDGKVTRVLTVVQDITELKGSQQEVRAGRALLRRAERVAHLGCWEWHLQSDEMWWSEEHYRIFGREPGSFVPSFDGLIEHMVSEDRSKVRDQLEEIYAGLEQATVEFRINTLAGEERMIRGIATLRRDENGKPLLLFGTVQDISEEHAEREHWEEECQALQIDRRKLEELLRERTGELDRALDRLRRGR